MPLAPPLFSITNDWPSRGVSSFAVARMMTSVTLPAAIGTITRIGRAGAGRGVSRERPDREQSRDRRGRGKATPRTRERAARKSRHDASLWCRHGPPRARWLFELVGDLVDAGFDAGLVLLAAGSAGGAGRADHVFADLDRQCAAPGGEAGEILRAHLRILLQPVFHLARRDTERA